MNMSDKIEKRVLALTNDIRYRAVEEDGKRFIEGYAAVFSSRSKLIMEMGELFYEEVERGAFADILVDPELDVILNFNHSRDLVMARTTNGTLTLSEDDAGLFFRAEIPDVTYANDTYELVKNGTFFENSFGFLVDSDGFRWATTDEDVPLRIISKVRKLIDVSIVTYGAYPETSVEARDLPNFKDEVEEEEDNTFETMHKLRSNEIKMLK